MDVTPIASTVGARIDGVDLRGSLDADEVAALRRAVLEHGVVFLPAQGLDDDRQVALARVFGEPHPHPVGAFLGDDSLMGSVATDDYKPGVDSHFHTDYTFDPHVPDFAILRADVVPTHGGDTMWASTTAAFDALVAVAAVVPRGARRVPQSGVGVQRHRGATFRRGRGSPDPRALRRHDPPGGHRAPGDGPQRGSS